MSSDARQDSFIAWIDAHMTKGGSDVPARLLTLLGLLERLRETPTLHIDAHKAASGMQLIEHNGFVDRALARFGVTSPVQEKGRRSNNLHAWANPLFDWLRQAGFAEGQTVANDNVLLWTQEIAAKRLAVINEDKPLVARYNRCTAVAIIADLLDQAQEKKRAKDVAEYLVGAKLELRFGEGIVTPKNVNTPSGANLADFRVGNMAIEVTTVERPDKSHLDQLAGILSNTNLQVWFLTRLRDRERWQTAIDAMFETPSSRIVVADVETFVGQNITEIGKFRTDDVRAELTRLFEQYGRRWLPPVGAGGLRIVSMEGPG